MSDGKHSPGPWQIGSEPTYVIDEHGRVIARAQTWADARLIAAAPELLEMLERVVEGWHVGDDKMDKARGLIRRVRGLEPTP